MKKCISFFLWDLVDKVRRHLNFSPYGYRRHYLSVPFGQLIDQPSKVRDGVILESLDLLFGRPESEGYTLLHDYIWTGRPLECRYGTHREYLPAY